MRFDNILIDVSNLFHRGYAVMSSMTHVMSDGTEMVTGGIYNSIRMIQKIESEYLSPGGMLYLLFDNCFASDDRRKIIDPMYKANRTKADVSFARSLDLFQLIALSYKDNWVIVNRQGYEADDLVYPIVSSIDGTSLLISNDMDWMRALSETVSVGKYEEGGYVIYDRERFKNKMGFYPSLSGMCIYKSFRGDTSDNIPAGVSGMRSKDLSMILDKYVSDRPPLDIMKDIIRDVDTLDLSDAWKDKIRENKSRLLLNCRLVDYLHIGKDEMADAMFSSRFQPRVLYTMYESLGFDVSKIDPRVMQFFEKREKKISDDSFFQKSMIPRI